jgi:2'-deoxymugineic-acid 2'-dioxygenase / mugineic-acid 3-dioxygenase
VSLPALPPSDQRLQRRPGAKGGVFAFAPTVVADPTVPHALVVNLGQQLEVVTNGVLRSIEHRVMTNSAMARTSVALFVAPTEDCLVGPAEKFLSQENPPCYRTLKFHEFKRTYNVVKLGSSINQRTNLRNMQKEI